MRIRKAVLPVAGLGTRVLPASKVIPKEMLPLVDKPTLQYIVEEAVAAGIEEIIFVTSRSKLEGLIAREGARRLMLGLLSMEEARTLLASRIGNARVEAEPAQLELAGRGPEHLAGLLEMVREEVARLVVHEPA